MKSQALIKQVNYFLIAGFIAVSIDYSIYSLTLNHVGLILSKLFGFYSGVVISFLMNSLFTFKKIGKRFVTSKYFLRYFILLSINMLINVTINFLLIKFFFTLPNINFWAFSVATFFRMLLNFIGMKLLVFRC